VSTAVRDIADRAHGYGIPGVVVDGNDPSAVYEAMSAALERARRGDGPSLIEAKVTRLAGHYIGDAQPYRPKHASPEDDPLPRFKQTLLETGVLDEGAIARLEEEIGREIEHAVSELRAAPMLRPELALEDLYASAEA
jgi:pyruvate dehydrogenase E1 component alpha subunit